MAKITRFEDLKIWKLSLSITKDIYDITSKGIFKRDFGLRDQIRRAIISVSSNIVEGFEKNNNNELIRYLKIAKGSAGEVRNQLHIALTVDHITEKEFEMIHSRLLDLTAQIGKFISYLEQKRKSGEFKTR